MVLSTRGRLARRLFIGAVLLLASLFVLLFVFLDTMVSRTATWILYPPFFWMALALSVKRLHDGGRSAWWLTVAAIPVLGPLVLFIMLFLLRGSAGENPWGPDTTPEPLDYLRVDIAQPGPEAS